MTERQEGYKDALILIVDDNPTNVKLLEMTLEVDGYNNIHSTTDPREVLGLQQKNKFDLILLNIQMPYLDGFQVMGQLRNVQNGSTSQCSGR